MNRNYCMVIFDIFLQMTAVIWVTFRDNLCQYLAAKWGGYTNELSIEVTLGVSYIEDRCDVLVDGFRKCKDSIPGPGIPAVWLRGTAWVSQPTYRGGPRTLPPPAAHAEESSSRTRRSHCKAMSQTVAPPVLLSLIRPRYHHWVTHTLDPVGLCDSLFTDLRKAKHRRRNWSEEIISSNRGRTKITVPINGNHIICTHCSEPIQSIKM